MNETERDDLADLIEGAVDETCYNADQMGPSGLAYAVALRAAEATLAAGYRRPRTVTTVEELDALLHGDANIVLLDEDGISLQNLAGGWQAATGSRRLMTSDLTFHCFGPTFKVLHEEVPS